MRTAVALLTAALLASPPAAGAAAGPEEEPISAIRAEPVDKPLDSAANTAKPAAARSRPPAGQHPAAQPRPARQAGQTGPPAPAPAEPLASLLEVEEVAFSTAVAGMMPAGRADAFEAGAGKVYFWNRVRALRTPARVRHAWYADDAKVDEFWLVLKHPVSRVWTYKTVRPGLWRVEVLAEDGSHVMSAAFPVRPAKPASPR